MSASDTSSADNPSKREDGSVPARNDGPDSNVRRASRARVGFAIRFVPLAGAALALCYFPYRRGSEAAAVVRAVLHAYAVAAGLLLRVVDPGVQVHGVEINGAFFMRMVRTCDAMDVTILLVAAIACWPGSILRRIVASLAGALALGLLNLFRICSLYVVGMVRPSLFDTRTSTSGRQSC